MKKISLFITIFAIVMLGAVHVPGANYVHAADTYSISEYDIPLTLNNVSDVIYTSNGLYISDEGNKKVYNYDFATQKLNPAKLPVGLSTLNTPTRIEWDYHDKLFIAEKSLYRMYSVDQKTNESITYTSYYIGSEERNLSCIYDIAVSITGNMYALTQDSKILIKRADSERLELYCDLSLGDSPITSTPNSRLAVSLNSEILILSDGQALYNINSNGTFAPIQNFTLPALDNIADLALDHKNDLYVLNKSASSQVSIIHSQKNEFKSCTLTALYADTLGFSLDVTNGKIYFSFAQGVKESIIQQGSVNFVNTLSDEKPPVDYLTALLDSPAGIIKTTANTSLYTYDNLLAVSAQLPQNTKLVILNEQADSDFYYVLATSISNYNVPGYVLKSQAETVQVSGPAFNRGRVITTHAKVYSYPSTLMDRNGNELSVAELSQGDVVDVISDSVISDNNGIEFLAIKFTKNQAEYVGYVDKNCLIDAQIQDLDELFVSNAVLRINTDVYSDEGLTQKLTQLEKGAKVSIVREENGVSLIQWEQDGQIVSGYVNSSLLNDGKITVLQIVGLALMALSIIAIISLACMTRSRQKKNEDD